jgi:hypothetical protein
MTKRVRHTLVHVEKSCDVRCTSQSDRWQNRCSLASYTKTNTIMFIWYLLFDYQKRLLVLFIIKTRIVPIYSTQRPRAQAKTMQCYWYVFLLLYIYIVYISYIYIKFKFCVMLSCNVKWRSLLCFPDLYWLTEINLHAHALDREPLRHRVSDSQRDDAWYQCLFQGVSYNVDQMTGSTNAIL